MEKFSDLEKLGVSSEMLAFFNEKGDKVLNNEGRSLGDTFKVTGLAKTPTSSEINGRPVSWADAITDNGTISLATLAGTPNIRKYFNVGQFQMSEVDGNMVSSEVDDNGNPLLEITNDFDIKNVVKFDNNRMSTIARACLEGGLVYNQELKIVAIRRNFNKRFDSWNTYYLFAKM